MKKQIIDKILTLLILLFCFLLGFTVNEIRHSKVKIIKTPLLIYKDLSIRGLDYSLSQGLIGVIDQKDLEKLLGLNPDKFFETLIKIK
ncbi:MAG TPA: hypothetical protein PLK41_04505 [Defluviitoga tunisiensis]|nr:hypothetical protein [bacterium]HPP10232.1 hypothetical protein [Defluviitoga tunisiensis]